VSRPSISVFFPCYNDSRTIGDLVVEAERQLQALTDDYEIIVVNDGSSDDSAEVLRGLAGRMPRLTVITHERNRGYGGLADRMPKYAAAFMVFTMANVGLPGTSGFIGEFLTLLAAFKANTWVAILATTGIILSAAYALYLYRRIIFGALQKANLRGILDLSPREIAIMAPLVLLTIFYGFYPAPVLDVTAASVKNLVQNYQAAQQTSAASLAP